MPDPELFSAPDDLSLVGEADLGELETRAVEEFDRVVGLPSLSPENVTYSQRLAGDLDRIRAELRVRAVRAEELATTQQQERARQMAILRQSVHGAEGGQGAEGEPAPVTAGGRIDMAALTEAAARGIAAAMGEQNGNGRRVASLSQVRERAPQAKVPDATMAVTASVDIPGVAAGQSMPTLE
ncbi:hypothetical protein, partial [Streptomyces sp. NPDC001781]